MKWSKNSGHNPRHCRTWVWLLMNSIRCKTSQTPRYRLGLEHVSMFRIISRTTSKINTVSPTHSICFPLLPPHHSKNPLPSTIGILCLTFAFCCSSPCLLPFLLVFLYSPFLFHQKGITLGFSFGEQQQQWSRRLPGEVFGQDTEGWRLAERQRHAETPSVVSISLIHSAPSL